MKYYRIIPKSIRLKIKQLMLKKKYDVILYNGAIGVNTFFEGKNVLRNNAQICNSYLGYASYLAENTVLRKIKIGKYCAIGQNVRNGLSIHPSRDFVSIHPAFYSTAKQGGFTYVSKQKFEEHKYLDNEKKYFNEIGNDVWIGNNVILLDGIRIEDGAIIAAGSIVTKDVEPYTIVGGVYAKTIRKRFKDTQIKFLLELKWWNKDIDWIKKNVEFFADINKFLSNCK